MSREERGVLGVDPEEPVQEACGGARGAMTERGMKGKGPAWYDRMYYKRGRMTTNKVAITIEEKLLKRLDRAVALRKFPNRSRAIQEAVQEKLDRLDRSRLAREAAKLDRASEQKLADEGLLGEANEWPEF